MEENMKCKICKSEALEKVYDEKHNNNYYFCSTCDYIFLDNREIVGIREEKEVYDGHDNSFECEGYVDMFENFLEKAVNPFIQTTGLALEFGSGPGPVLATMLENRGWEVKKHDKFFESDLDYKDYHYDLITSTEVFEHFDDPLKEIEKITNLMKDGSILAIMTLLRPKTKEEFLKWWYRRDKTHISFYSLKTLEYIANQFDLKIIYSDHERLITFKKK